MLFKNITIIDENFEEKNNMYVGIKGATIDYVSSEMPKEDYGDEYDGKGKLLCPAFYNIHSHLPMVFMRGYGENLSLMSWLNDKIFPFEAQLTDDDLYSGCLLGIAEMLRYGIASSTDMYIKNMIPLGRAFTESKVKANFSVSLTCFDDSSFEEHYLYNNIVNALDTFKGIDGDRIKPELSLHSEYTTSEKIAKGLAEFANKNDASMHVHVSETANEVLECKKRHEGRSPVKYLHDCGIFSVPTVAAHCVYLDDDDINILKEDKVSVASCPKSNAKLASGICEVDKLLMAGVNVGIGTDSVASNNNLNMVEEMRFFNLLQKATVKDPTVITPKQTLYAATRAGALAQKRDDCGLIKEGFKADLTVFDIDKIYMKPVHNIVNNLVYSAAGNDVVLTMVDGRVLYKDGEYTTLDIELLEYELRDRTNRILQNL